MYARQHANGVVSAVGNPRPRPHSVPVPICNRDRETAMAFVELEPIYHISMIALLSVRAYPHRWSLALSAKVQKPLT
jgi:hypothetical protein